MGDDREGPAVAGLAGQLGAVGRVIHGARTIRRRGIKATSEGRASSLTGEDCLFPCPREH
jgi:hypothetical protein